MLAVFKEERVGMKVRVSPLRDCSLGMQSHIKRHINAVPPEKHRCASPNAGMGY